MRTRTFATRLKEILCIEFISHADMQQSLHLATCSP